jgi:hypothetical protein
MKTFCFTIDDNIRFLKEIAGKRPGSMFDHPYLAMLKRLHQKFDLKVQMNMFYRMDGFELSQMCDDYRKEWKENSDWLKMSFHSDVENVLPYKDSGYDEVFSHCKAVNDEIFRFSCEESLAKTTTVNYCQTTHEGVKALWDNDLRGLLGLFGNEENPGTSYSLDKINANDCRNGKTVLLDGMSYASIDMVINGFALSEIVSELTKLLSRDSLRVMIHEQYFYEDYRFYQPDFEEKLITVFQFLCDNGYKSCFFEELI